MSAKIYHIKLNEKVYEVEIEEVKKGENPLPKKQVKVKGSGQSIDAPMPGNIWKVLVAEGDEVKTGDTLIILEAMKMENELVAPRDGKVSKIMTSEGTSVNTGDKLLIIE